MSRQSNRKRHRMLAYVMAFVLLLTAVPVAVSQASDYTLPTTFASQAANYLTEWNEKGNDGKTTLFIGDSTMSPQIWRNFYEMYEGKDVLRAGIGGSRTDDWKLLATDYLAHTNPKNLVVHIGGNDISGSSYSNGVKKDADTTYADIVALLELLHETLPETNLYYFGIKTRASTTNAATIQTVNELTKEWCDNTEWVSYADTSAVVADDLYDGIHINMESYIKMKNALAATDIEIEDAKKNIDIYLIAGQSNAAGYSQYDADVLSSMDTRYVDGFENIYYSGTVAQLGNIDNSLRDFPIQTVKAGLGIGKEFMGTDKDFIGPEIGMAESLSSLYNEETGAYAGFIKYAVGGSSLLNDLTNTANETWTSPTYMESLGTEVTDGTQTGVLYDNFLMEVEKRLAEYEAAGFNPIIKGMYWMQGEADRRREAEYIDAFEDFASDVRTDLTTIAGQDLSEMPIMVGEISETFYAYKTATLNANREFIAMQDMLSSLVSDCYLIDNSGFAITAEDPDNPVPEDQDSEEYANYTGLILGSDHAHWNYKDCIAIGNQVGDQIQKLDTVETGDINADTRVDGTDLSKLRNMLVRNVDVSSQMITPDVYVSYDGGQVVNDGDAAIAVETCQFDTNTAPTAFVATEDVSYTASRNGDANGAIVTNHQTGPYTVVRDYEFGKEDFTISTWFNVPEEATLSGGGGSYIMGIDEPNGTTGFSATLKDGSLRFKLLSTSSRQLQRIEGNALSFTVNRDEWYNLVISREGRVINVFFGGELLFTESIPEGYNFGTRDLGVGAYVGYSSTYFNYEMRFDDVQVYGTALSANEIKAIAESGVLIPERNDVNLDATLDVKDLVDLKIAASNYTGTTPFDVEAADAAVNFDGGVVKNTGTNANIAAGTYVLGGFETVVVNGQEKQKATRFDPTDDVDYTIGRDGAANGAILTNNRNGAYTVLDNANLGKEDFAVSTWFNVPEGETIGGGNGCYLLGTTNADDTTNGFRVTLRTTDVGVRLAYKSGTNSQEYHTIADFNYGEWHHVAVSRIGNALFLYSDGELAQIQIIGENFDFGNSKIAFGAYPGVTWKYDDTDVAYDDVCFYKGEVTVSAIREIFGYEDVSGGDEGGDDSGDVGGDTGDDTTEPTTAKVRVTFNGGKVANSGTDTSIKANTYVLNGTSGFTATNNVTYTTGRDGSSNGAIVTNHLNGPYTVVENYNFGTSDFTVSTWFNMEDVSVIKNVSGGYLFGTVHPDSGNGFSVVLKKNSSGTYEIRVRATTKDKTSEEIAGSKFYAIPDVTSDTWYNITAAKVGSVINIYFDGKLVGEHTVSDYNFGTKNLAFGAYYGQDYYYDANTYFDDIQVYGEGLSASQIQEKIIGQQPAKVRVTFNNGTVTNSGTDTSVTAKAYLMNGTTANATEFIETDTATYAAGRDGSANGAIITNHSIGPYTVLKNCNLGTGDFTISTWFNTERTSVIGIGAGGYLFGTSHPDADVDSGFSVVLKRKAKDTEDYQIRFKGAGSNTQFSGDGTGEGALPSIQANTWYNVVVARVGTTLNIYFDGEIVLTCSVGTFDFGAKDLAFGAQFGISYNNVNTYYDDIEVYGTGFSAEQVQKLYAMTK